MLSARHVRADPIVKRSHRIDAANEFKNYVGSTGYYLTWMDFNFPVRQDRGRVHMPSVTAADRPTTSSYGYNNAFGGTDVRVFEPLLPE